MLATTPVHAASLCNLSPDTLVRNFGAIAFGSEHRRIVRQRVTRWEVPIRYRVQDGVGITQVVRRDLHAHMRLLAKLTGHSILQARPGQSANFRIVFTRQSRFALQIRRGLNNPSADLIRRLSRADCVGIMQRDLDSNAILAATAIIPVDHARAHGLLYHCVVEETSQLMGLPNDSDDADFSIFNDRSRRDDLGCQDRLFLRLLYHPDLHAGMRKAEALRTARKLLPRLARERKPRR